MHSGKSVPSLFTRSGDGFIVNILSVNRDGPKIAHSYNFMNEYGTPCNLTHSIFFIILVQLDQSEVENLQKKIRDLTRDRTQITCLAVSDSYHYAKMFPVLL